MKKFLTFLTLLTLFTINGWAADVTVTRTLAEIATENQWTTSAGTNVHPYLSFSLDDNISVSTNSSGNNGSYWSDGYRLYRSANGVLTISAGTGYNLKSITLTFTTANNGCLKYNGSQITSNSGVTVSGTSASFTVDNTNNKTNGQAKITQISVTYEVQSSGLTDPSIIFTGFQAGGATVTATITPDENATDTYYRIGETGNYTKYENPVSINLKSNASPIKVYAYSTDDNETTEPVCQEYTVPALGISISPASSTGYDPVTVNITANNYVGDYAITYTINGGTAQDYSAPFTLSDPDTYEIDATVLDERAGDENEATSSATIIIKGAAAIPLPFEENFNAADGSGPVVGETWGGSIASSAFASDNEGWTYTNKAYSGAGCARFGTGSNAGNATTPLISGFTANSEYTLTFNAGAWNGAGTTLSLSSENGSFKDTEGNDLTSVTIAQNAWTDFEVIFIPTATTAKITFTNSSKQFFLDDVKVEAAEVVHYTIATTVSPERAETAGNAVWMQSGFETIDDVATSTAGTTVSFKAHTVNNWQVGGVVITNNTTQETIEPTSQTNVDDGIVYSFKMPKSNVTIAATFQPYQPDVYIKGNLNGGLHWEDAGLKMTYDPDNHNYSIRIYASDENGYFRFYANGGTNGSPSYGAGGVNLNPLEGTQPKDLWKDGDANFCVPAGIYDIVVGQVYDDPTQGNANWWTQTTVTVTKVEPTLTFKPAAGEIVSGTSVTVSSNLYELLSEINSSIEESAVSNQVKIGEGEYAASVPVTEPVTVTGRAKYLNIEKTATAEYTIKDVDARDIPYEEPFNNDSEFGLFTPDNQTIWTIGSNSGNYFAKATGYYKESGSSSSTNHAADSWLVSPLIDLRNASTPKLSFEQCINMYFGTVANEAELYIKVNGGEWQKQTITYPTLSGTWSQFEEQVVDLAGFAGQIIQVGFRYRSTTNKAGTWEIKNFNVFEIVATPTFSPESGTYTEAQTVSISCATDGATIMYKIGDGDYAEYTKAITISENTTLSAYATKDGYTDSEVATATYTFSEPVTPGDGDYVKVTKTADLTSGEYLIVYEDGSVAFNGGLETLDAASNTIPVTIANDKIAASAPVDAATFTIDVTAGTIKSKSGKYIGNDVYDNKLKQSEEASTYNNNTFSIDEGNAVITAVCQAGNTTLRYNSQSGQTRFRYFKSGQQPIALYKKVVEEPATDITLAGLVELGAAADGNKYCINDEKGLLGVYKSGNTVWFKDEVERTIVLQNETLTVIGGAVVDFDKPGDEQNYWIENIRTKDFDQSNWIEVDFTNVETPEAVVNGNKEPNVYIKNLTGTYSYNGGKRKLVLTETPAEVTERTQQDQPYVPNPYIPANFYGTQQGYFFSKPKVQEYAKVVDAKWNGTKMVMGDNNAGFVGSFTIEPVEGLTVGNYYTFHGIINRSIAGGESYSTPRLQDVDYDMITTDLAGQEGSERTAISTVGVNGEVKSVKYVNVAGVVSDRPFQGVNIVVTEYTDGSRTTTKVVK